MAMRAKIEAHRLWGPRGGGTDRDVGQGEDIYKEAWEGVA